MNTTISEEQLELLKRAAVGKAISEKLSQLPVTHGLGIALGVYIDVVKSYGLTVDFAADAVRNAWDADREDFVIPGVK